MTLSDLIKLEPGEKVVLKLRRHLIIFFGQMTLIALLSVVPLGAAYLINSLHPEWFRSALWQPVLILLTSAYYLNVWMFSLAIFTDYYLDAWIVTDRRVIDIQQSGLFSRTVAELDLSRVQDITSDVQGVLPSLLNYGNVHIQNAGEKERFTFEQIPNADRVRHELMQLVEKSWK